MRFNVDSKIDKVCQVSTTLGSVRWGRDPTNGLGPSRDRLLLGRIGSAKERSGALVRRRSDQGTAPGEEKAELEGVPKI